MRFYADRLGILLLFVVYTVSLWLTVLITELGIPSPPPYWAEPTMMWTTHDGRDCMGWRMKSASWFVQCNDGSFTTMTQGAMSSTIHSIGGNRE